jgi:hypothetical protein
MICLEKALRQAGMVNLKQRQHCAEDGHLANRYLTHRWCEFPKGRSRVVRNCSVRHVISCQEKARPSKLTGTIAMKSKGMWEKGVGDKLSPVSPFVRSQNSALSYVRGLVFVESGS